jgi:hypothetical protein
MAGFVASGTSCAVPVRFPTSLRSASGTQLITDVQTVAGVISLLNDHLLSTGQNPLGYLNPWLYGKGRPGLNDITSGSNPGCGTEGFSATAGWDAVRPPRLSFSMLADFRLAR